MTNQRGRTVGILGGMSNQSTVEYYRLVDEGVNEARGGHAAADLLIRSVDFADVERFIQSERWGRAGEYLAKAAMDLEAGGAEAVFMATNTMHKVAPDIEAVLSVPLSTLSTRPPRRSSTPVWIPLASSGRRRS